MKGNEDNDHDRLVGYSCARKWTDAELDMIEIAIYGGVEREGLKCRAKSNLELFAAFKHMAFKSRKPPLPDCP